MKKRILLAALFLSGGIAFAQKDNVGIGTTSPDKSAALEVNSTNKGLLMPRMSLQQRNAIQSPAKGLVVYQTDLLAGFYYFNGTEWKGLSNTEKSVAGTDGDWTLSGNTLNGTEFIGSTNDVPIQFRVNNIWAGYVTSGTKGNVGLGAYALFGNPSGGDNMGIGFVAGRNITTGEHNAAIGGYSLYTNTAGNYNVGIGAGALYGVTGSNNVGIGDNTLGTGGAISGNVAIGHEAGRNESGSNKLYIANTNTATPLVYGDFTAKYLAVGEVSAADRAANTSGGYRLLVKGGMITEKIKVATAGSTDWSDYVFDENYKRMSLDEIEAFVKENKHLPNVPTTEEMIANGNDLHKTDAKLLEKIEELTLYMIEMNKEIKSLKEENAKLKIKK
jgi:hypothetical protein